MLVMIIRDKRKDVNARRKQLHKKWNNILDEDRKGLLKKPLDKLILSPKIRILYVKYDIIAY